MKIYKIYVRALNLHKVLSLFIHVLNLEHTQKTYLNTFFYKTKALKTRFSKTIFKSNNAMEFSGVFSVC